MRKQFGLIGLGKFGRRVLEEMLLSDVEILIVDKDDELIEQYKNRVEAAFVADALKEETIIKIIPPTLDGVIIDLVDKLEVSILVTNYLKKIGIPQIIATAETDEHGEILEMVGATQVIFPNKEAARRVTPTLVSSALFSYFPIGSGLAIAEVVVPPAYHGKNVVESNLRREAHVNVIAVRSAESEHFGFFGPDYVFQPGDVLLIVGEEPDVDRFTGAPEHTYSKTISRVETNKGSLPVTTPKSTGGRGNDDRPSLSGLQLRHRFRRLFRPSR